MKIFFAMIITIFPLSTIAFELPKPTFDADKYCRDLKREEGDERSAVERYNACFDKRQEGYDRLKEIWNSMTKKEQADCLQILDIPNPSPLSPWGRLMACAIDNKLDPSRDMKRKAEQKLEQERRKAEELQELQRRDVEELRQIPKRELH